MKNYYKILEVEPTSTFEQIKSQHRFLLHAWHPDKFPGRELKAKAEEKVKEINEAYSVLSDSAKRESYDKALHSYSSPSAQPSYSRPSQNPSHVQPNARPNAQPKQYCESCGLPAETKYIEFYENIGMIFVRKHRSVKGNYCKFCINYYFWDLTGKTMLGGWWGAISFIVTPFILLNNLLRFIFTIGMKKPPLQIAPSPSPFLVFFATVGFLLIGLFFFSMFSSVSAQPTYSPSPTTAPISTRIPTKVKTPTVPASDCILWTQITPSMSGRKVCVYGTVYSVYTTNETSTRIKFTSQPNTFFLYDVNYIYTDLKEGDCVAAEEVVQLYDKKIPYMSVSALYHCESWMK